MKLNNSFQIMLRLHNFIENLPKTRFLNIMLFMYSCVVFFDWEKLRRQYSFFKKNCKFHRVFAFVVRYKKLILNKIRFTFYETDSKCLRKFTVNRLIQKGKSLANLSGQ